jgi:DNA repair exonuclease SbcCD ATPase subunit
MSLKVIRLTAENIKQVRAVDITPDDNMVVISGENEAGKTSVLDSLCLALRYSETKKDIKEPIRHGKEFAEIMTDLGDFVVKRTFRAGENGKEFTTRLTVETANGDVVKRPQELLDSFIGSLSFDPLEFLMVDGKKRRQMLGDMVHLNLADYDAKRKSMSDQRLELKREAKNIDDAIKQIAPPVDTDPTKEESSQEILERLTALQQEYNTKNNLEQTIRIKLAEIQELQNRISILQGEYNIANIQLATMPSNISEQLDKTAQKLHNLEKNNGRAREIAKYNFLAEKYQKITSELNDVNKSMTELEAHKTSLLKAAQLPVVGLEITDDDVIFDGLPLTQISASEQIKISVALVMAANPKLRIMRIKNGSLLDKKNFELIRSLAKDTDFQVWIECVDDSGKRGFYIENGEVAAANKCIT